MKKAYPLIFFFLTSLLSIQAQSVNIQNSEPSALSSIQLSRQITAIDLGDFFTTDNTSALLPTETTDQKVGGFPISTSFLSSLLNLLAEGGSDTFLKFDASGLDSCILKKEGSNQLNTYSVIDEKILAYADSLDLTSVNPYLYHLLKKKFQHSKNEKYLVIKLGTVDELSPKFENTDRTTDILTWSQVSEKNIQIDYFLFKKTLHDSGASLPTSQGELWMLISKVDSSEPNSTLNEETSLIDTASQLAQNNSPAYQAASADNSVLKNQSTWWNSKTPEQKMALIKTGVFLGGCLIATAFPELPVMEKILILVCLPCFIELADTLRTAWNAL
ncbi:MAG: hypothetical protein K2W97_08555 [Chthoniobacterales bacterium]|nr:hypothetical protein [Chthoniobacterales bacterium]